MAEGRGRQEAGVGTGNGVSNLIYKLLIDFSPRMAFPVGFAFKRACGEGVFVVLSDFESVSHRYTKAVVKQGLSIPGQSR